MPRSLVAGLLAAVAATMSGLIGPFHGDLVWIALAGAAGAAGLGGALVAGPLQKKSVMFTIFLSRKITQSTSIGQVAGWALAVMPVLRTSWHECGRDANRADRDNGRLRIASVSGNAVIR